MSKLRRGRQAIISTRDLILVCARDDGNIRPGGLNLASLTEASTPNVDITSPFNPQRPSSLPEATPPANCTMMSARFARAGLRATQFSVPRTAAVNGIRSYATPAQETRAPVALFGVDGTYASALVCTSIAPVLLRPCVGLFATKQHPVFPRPLPQLCFQAIFKS